MKIVNAQQMREIDNKAINDYKIPSIVLMENAGIRTVEVIEDYLGEVSGKAIVIVAGTGNNGGDGLVIARHLINAGAKVDVFVIGQLADLTTDTLINYNIIKNIKGKLLTLENDDDLDKLMLSIIGADLIVDSIFGIGFKGKLNDYTSQVISMLNWAKAPIIAVDIPSGLEADTGKVPSTAIKATHTITFGLPKIGLILELAKDYVGTLSVADISLPAQLLNDRILKSSLITPQLIRPFLEPRLAETHKGTYGHVLVVGGSIGLTGAVVMTGNAAIRTGAGLVTVAAPESLLPIIHNHLTEVMTSPLAETGQATIALEAKPALENLLGTVSACAIGPGMARYPEALAIVDFVLERSGVPIIIDADGLNAVKKDISILKDRQVPIVLTPHPGEMAGLIGKSIAEIQANRLEVAQEFATEWGVTLVLKGNNTIIATANGETYININGNPGMATGGSGDVLTGIIASLIAQGLNPVQASVAGVYMHGAVGDKVAGLKGQKGMIAGDLIEFLPDILREFE